MTQAGALTWGKPTTDDPKKYYWQLEPQLPYYWRKQHLRNLLNHFLSNVCRHMLVSGYIHHGDILPKIRYNVQVQIAIRVNELHPHEIFLDFVAGLDIFRSITSRKTGSTAKDLSVLNICSAKKGTYTTFAYDTSSCLYWRLTCHSLVLA